jgi:hypothetical protein
VTETGRDDMDDDARDRAGDDGAWMTYKQLAESRHISPRAAVRMTQRHRLRRQPGNDGQVLVWVPRDVAEPQRQSQRDDRSDDTGDNARDTGLTAGALAALETAILSLTERALVAERRADGAETVIAAERSRADRADAALTAERARVDALRERVDDLQAGQGLMMDMHVRALAAAQGDLDMARAQATTAHDALKALRQAEADRKARGLLSRLRAAVRGR